MGWRRGKGVAWGYLTKFVFTLPAKVRTLEIGASCPLLFPPHNFCLRHNHPYGSHSFGIKIEEEMQEVKLWGWSPVQPQLSKAEIPII